MHGPTISLSRSDDKNYGIYNAGSNCMSYSNRVKQFCIAKNLQYEKYLFTNNIIVNRYKQDLNTKKFKSVFKFNFDWIMFPNKFESRISKEINTHLTVKNIFYVGPLKND